MRKSHYDKKAPTLAEFNIGEFQKGQTVPTIYLGNLRYNIMAKDLENMFKKFGKVTFVKLVVDPKTRKSKGIAFIQMPERKDAIKAIRFFDGKVVDGRTLKASFAKHSAEAKAPSEEEKKDIIKSIPLRKKKVKKGLDALFANTGRN